jgi:hypothetical protein
MPKKLTPNDIDFILERLAANHTTEDAVADLKKNHGVEITTRRAYQLKKEHFEVYEFKRERYLKTFDDTPLAYAKNRLKECNRLFREACTENDKDTQISVLNLAQRIAEPLRLEAQGRGVAKEVEDFIASVAFGQADNSEVPANA